MVLFWTENGAFKRDDGLDTGERAQRMDACFLRGCFWGQKWANKREKWWFF
jgi:hypothetical protein